MLVAAIVGDGRWSLCVHVYRRWWLNICGCLHPRITLSPTRSALTPPGYPRWRPGAAQRARPLQAAAGEHVWVHQGDVRAHDQRVHSFSRSYGVILPSSLERVISRPLVYSTYPPVSVMVQAFFIYDSASFSWKYDIHYFDALASRTHGLSSKCFLHLSTP